MLSADFKGVNMHVGDNIRVSSTVVEGNKQRVQIFEGILISINGRGENRMFTVRKIGSGGIGIERKWPLNARTLVKIEVKKKTSGVRRSKLYYLRKLVGKGAVRV